MITETTMISEITKLINVKEKELAMVQINFESLISGMDEIINKSNGKLNKHFWKTYNSLNAWQNTLRSELLDLKSMLEKTKDIQAKLDQLTNQ